MLGSGLVGFLVLLFTPDGGYHASFLGKDRLGVGCVLQS